VWFGVLSACEGGPAPTDSGHDSNLDSHVERDTGSADSEVALDALDARVDDSRIPDGASDARMDSGAPPLAADVESLLDAFCDNEVMCANHGPGLFSFAHDACHRFHYGDRPELWTAGLASGRLSRGAAFDACIAALASSCVYPSDPCVYPFDRAVAEDEACYLDDECLDGLLCLSNGACPRTCQPPRADGELCGAATSCGLGSCPTRYPVGDTFCSAWGLLGGPCPPSGFCEPGAFCDGGTCVAQGASGEDCTPLDGGFSIECLRGLVCTDDGTGTDVCTEAGDLTEGDSCALDFGDACPPDYACAPPTGDRSCRLGVPLGAACGSSSPCQRAARCVSGTCVRVVRPGEPCGADAACTDQHYCAADGTCHPDPVIGESCPTGARCLLGACAADGVCRALTEGETCGFLECVGECDISTRRCLAPLAEGEQCNWSGGYCEPGLECREDATGRGRCLVPCRP
jgi:hypothetical protein